MMMMFDESRPTSPRIPCLTPAKASTVRATPCDTRWSSSLFAMTKLPCSDRDHLDHLQRNRASIPRDQPTVLHTSGRSMTASRCCTAEAAEKSPLESTMGRNGGAECTIDGASIQTCRSRFSGRIGPVNKKSGRCARPLSAEEFERACGRQQRASAEPDAPRHPVVLTDSVLRRFRTASQPQAAPSRRSIRYAYHGVRLAKQVQAYSAAVGNGLVKPIYRGGCPRILQEFALA